MLRSRAGLFKLSQLMTRQHKQLVIWLMDVLWAPVALFAVMVSSYPQDWQSEHLERLALLLPFVALVSGVVSICLGLPWIKLKSYEAYGPFRLLPLGMTVGLALLLITFMPGLHLSFLSTANFTLIFLCGSYGLRLLMLNVLLWALRSRKAQTRVLIYGAGETGLQLASALKMHEAISVIGFVDDDRIKTRERMAGLRIYPAERIEELVRSFDVSRVILAMPSASTPKQTQTARQLQDMGVEVQIVPSFAQLVGTEAFVNRLTLLTPEQFLGRKELDAALPSGREIYRDRVVMVSGAGGSIGSELCRQLVRYQPKCLVLLESSEHALYTIDQELAALNTKYGVKILPVLGSVTDARAVKQVLRENGVEIVLHAAAYKHVPLVEANPIAGLNNNVMGTRILADACAKYGVERFLLISTDKAVRPANVMGASKRLAEMVVQDLATRHSATQFAIVRFGNVLGSSGSVIPLFKAQIEKGGPVTVTHNEVTRYFMTIPEAVRLVLLAGSFTDEDPQPKADVFVLDMGAPVRIRDLAESLIREAGYSLRSESNPQGDIEIKVTGLRPGEKLYEELLIGEGMINTPHPKIKRAAETIEQGIQVPEVLQELTAMIAKADVDGARSLAFGLTMAKPQVAYEFLAKPAAKVQSR